MTSPRRDRLATPGGRRHSGDAGLQRRRARQRHLWQRCCEIGLASFLPAIGLVLVLSVDWFIGMVRALGNLIGNCVATVVVAAWEKELDLPLAEAVLDSDVVVEARAA